MTLKIQIMDPNSGRSARVCNGEEDNALVVATRPLKNFEAIINFFTNTDYGSQMAQNASTGGIPDKVHDGTDSALWTGTQISGGSDVVFNSTNQNHTGGGTKSIYFNRLEINDTINLSKGSDIDLNNYTSITLWIYIDNNWSSDSFSFYAWDTAGNVIRGNKIYLQNYCNVSNFDVWQKITIPLTDLNIEKITTIDSFRVQCEIISGTKTRFYLDDIQVEETGIPLFYDLKPTNGTWLHVKSFTFSFIDAYSPTMADTGMSKLPYNSFLGLANLNNGMIYKRVQSNIIKFSQNLNNMMGILELDGTNIINCGSDGTNTWVTIKSVHGVPFILKSEFKDYLSFTVNDDMSDLISFKVSAECFIEDRSDCV